MIKSFMFSFTAAVGFATAVSHPRPSSNSTSPVSSWTNSTQDLFSQAMTFLDSFYDKRAGYLYDLSSAEGLRHESRQSVFYALGLLARNQGLDSEEAAIILNNIVKGQVTDPTSEAYGDYQIYPEQPKFGTAYPAVAYTTYYGISRAIMGNALVVALEEFPHLLSAELTTTLRSSLELNLRSNYTPTQSPASTAYALSTAFLALWGGQHLNQSNLGGGGGGDDDDGLNVTAQGEALAQAVIDNFDTYGGIAEFNAPAYLTFTFWPLAMATKYLGPHPASTSKSKNGSSVVVPGLAQRAPDLIAGTWTRLAQWYHPDLQNLAAPLSRGFGYDLTRYMHGFGLYLWSFHGRAASPFAQLAAIPPLPRGTDFANAVMTALYADTLAAAIPDAALDELKTFAASGGQERLVRATAFAEGKDRAPQNLTAWLAGNITIGGASYASSVLGPYTESIYIPGAIQWLLPTGDDDRKEVGYINVYSNEAAMDIVASPHVLNVSLPNATATSTIEFHVGAFADGHDWTAWQDTTGLSVSVRGAKVDLNFTVGFAGSLGGTGGSAIQQCEFWNVSYSMAEDFAQGHVPWVALEVFSLPTAARHTEAWA